MKTMLFQKSLLAALIAAMLLALFPLAGASAAGLYDTPTPPAPQHKGPTTERIENAWQRLLRAYDRLGRLSDRSDELFARANRLITVLKAMGANTTNLEAALTDFESAVQQAKPIYASCADIVKSHAGFDANGKVTDRDQAIQTLRSLGSKLREIRDLLKSKGQALVDQWKPIRDALHPSVTPAPAP